MPKASYLYKVAAKLKRQTRILSKNLRMAEDICNMECFKELAVHVDAVTYQFIMSQVRTQKFKPRGRRFTLDDKILALSLYKQSGKAYKLLTRIFSLPS
ncbi:hypothetical protein PR048_014097 [Dryococelus australis]|uniref:Transposase n=1 Tax=Dryococelus australis TaxID=614101 RepID=A0ABQ9HDJ1_9NEOP|nr:hypothetical protein PR048_014097 [Dryococelus australis]